ncbi:hypothetical protein [Sinorhizobium alkalisoli]|uniref:hypothetical protein n=1 Tax=Sinorhizobium alkalisoli TaxID=1752398 RepID=UPI001FE298C4|nr:hypothetical protein [Sinorhizobium alkalisoli]
MADHSTAHAAKIAKSSIFRQIPHSIGGIAFALAAQTGHAVRWDAVENANIDGELAQKFQPVEQAIHIVGVGADFELTQPHKARHSAIGSFGKQGQKPSAALRVQTPCNTGRDRPFGGDQGIGTASFDG